jgi:hypothetical protein
MKDLIKRILNEVKGELLTEVESFNIPANFYQSGKDEVTPELDKQLQGNDGPKLVRYLRKNPKNMVDITITSSESKVPNQPPFQKPKSLAQSRGEKLKQYFEKNLQKYKNQVRYKIVPIVSGPAWDGKNKDDKKYTDAQYIKVSYQVSSEPIKSNNNTNTSFGFKNSNFCKTRNIKVEGGKAEKPEYIGYKNKFDVGMGDGGFDFTFIPYMYPDRIAIKSGNQIYDSGYVCSDKITKGLIQHIIQLSAYYHNNPTSPAFQNIKTIIDISQTQPNEVLPLMIQTMKKEGITLTGDMKKSKQVVESLFGKGKQIKNIVYYKKSKGFGKFTKDPKDKIIEVRVFSPVDKTIFDLNYKCV